MYTSKDRKKAIKLYYKYGKKYSLVVHELGYPSPVALRGWIREYEDNGKIHEKYVRKARFSKTEIKTAVNYFRDHGRSIAVTVNALGYPCRYTLQKWLKEYDPDYKPRVHKISSVKHDENKKTEASLRLCTSNRNAEDIAQDYNVTRTTLYQWKNKALGKGNQHSMTKKNNNEIEKLDTEEKLNNEISKLKSQLNSLKKDMLQLRMEKDALEKAAELIKKDQGISLKSLTNREKTIVIDALRNQYKLKPLLTLLEISKSSYEYNRKALLQEDKYLQQRQQIKRIYNESYKRYGYRRIHHELKKKGVILSEKVVRRIMKEDSLIVYVPKKKKYSSYEGEISPAADNLIQRDFHAQEPFEKLLTDISEFHIPAGKVYLSPMIDCFDGLPLAWTIGTSPNAKLANTMLEETIKLTPDDKHPIIHSDRGCHYRWPLWIDMMNEAGFIRSMSKKGCSPDNAACEAFFGRLKNEFFYCRSWEGVSIEEFIRQLDEYIRWYGSVRIKMSLGGLSPLEYRKSLNFLPVNTYEGISSYSV